MVSIKRSLLKYSQDFKDVEDTVNEIYYAVFQNSFEFIKYLDQKLKDEYHPISDEDLEQILTGVPLKLFDASEYLHDLELRCQVIKLSIKKSKLNQKYDADDTLSKTEKEDKAALDTIEDELLLSIYNNVIARVHSEISLSKELIMGAKKVWDRRKEVESSMPVNPVDDKNSGLGKYVEE